MVLRRDAHGRLSGVRRENRPAVASPVTWVRSSSQRTTLLSNGAGEGSRPATGRDFQQPFPACTLERLVQTAYVRDR